MKDWMKKYRFDVIIIAISIFLSLFAFTVYPILNSVFDKSNFPGGNSVFIEVNGELYGTYDLNIDQTIEVKSDYGFNLVEIKEGRAYVSDADCPDKLCVNDRLDFEDELNKNGDFLKEIICLPNRMVLRIGSFDEDEEGYDAIAY